MPFGNNDKGAGGGAQDLLGGLTSSNQTQTNNPDPASGVGNLVGGLVGTVGGVVGATGQGLGSTVNNTTGTRAVGDGLTSVTDGLDGATRSVQRGVEDLGKAPTRK